jgi:beta-phosphoglucomutase
MDSKKYSNYCVIFDMDGVLADTSPIHFESWVKLGKEIGFEFTREFFEQTCGQQSPTIIRKLVGADIEQDLVEKWANIKEKYYREMIQQKLEPLPGAVELINRLKSKGFKLALGSSAPPENVELLLTGLKIKRIFDIVVTAADVDKSKPEPDVFLIASKKLKVKPQNCIVIEDAPVGIEAAKRAEMKTIALTTTYDWKELQDAQVILKDLAKVKISDILKLFT